MLRRDRRDQRRHRHLRPACAGRLHGRPGRYRRRGDLRLRRSRREARRKVTPMTDAELARELIESAGVNAGAVVWQETMSPLCDQIARAALAEDYAETRAQFPGEE